MGIGQPCKTFSVRRIFYGLPLVPGVSSPRRRDFPWFCAGIPKSSVGLSDTAGANRNPWEWIGIGWATSNPRRDPLENHGCDNSRNAKSRRRFAVCYALMRRNARVRKCNHVPSLFGSLFLPFYLGCARDREDDERRYQRNVGCMPGWSSWE